MSIHSDAITWFRVNQSLIFLLNVVCLVEKQQIPMLVFCLNRTVLEPTIYWGKQVNHYTTGTDTVTNIYNVVYMSATYKYCINRLCYRWNTAKVGVKHQSIKALTVSLICYYFLSLPKRYRVTIIVSQTETLVTLTSCLPCFYFIETASCIWQLQCRCP